jgi:hypothetical protein
MEKGEEMLKTGRIVKFRLTPVKLADIIFPSLQNQIKAIFNPTST